MLIHNVPDLHVCLNGNFIKEYIVSRYRNKHSVSNPNDTLRILVWSFDINAPVSNTMLSSEWYQYSENNKLTYENVGEIEFPSIVSEYVLSKNKAGRNREHLNDWSEIFSLYSNSYCGFDCDIRDVHVHL